LATIQWALKVSLWKEGSAITSLSGQEVKRMHTPAGLQLNPSILLTCYKADKSIEEYFDQFYVKENRPLTRDGETSGRFAYTRPFCGDTKIRIGSEIINVEGNNSVVEFFEMRKVTIDVEVIESKRIGNDPGWLFTKETILYELQKIQTLYSEEQRGVMPKSFKKLTNKKEAAMALAHARKCMIEAKIKLSEIHATVASPGTSLSMSAVDLSNWGVDPLSDRGDGLPGKPQDHVLISFNRTILDGLDSDEENGDDENGNVSDDGFDATSRVSAPRTVQHDTSVDLSSVGLNGLSYSDLDSLC
jgi:hypothetical protein